MVVTVGKFIGSDLSFKGRKKRGNNSGLAIGSWRKHSLEVKALDDKQDQEQAKTKEISRRQKEKDKMRKKLEQNVSEESNPDRNTEVRRKLANVARPTTEKDNRNSNLTLTKQAEIKTKIIDEVRSMTLQKYHNLPDSLVSAVRAVMEKKMQEDDDDAKKKSAKSSKDDDDDDDDSDKKVGVGNKKTKVDINPTAKSVKEEAEQIDELSRKTLASYTKKAGIDLYAKGVKQGVDISNDKRTGKLEKKIGNRLYGITQSTTKLAKEEVSLSDEETARILAKLNEASDDDEKHEDGPEHIVMQLRKAKSLGAANRPIHFHDGSKVKVDAGHVQKALDMHGSFKKAPDKDEFTKKLQASHSSFKSAIGAK